MSKERGSSLSEKKGSSKPHKKKKKKKHSKSREKKTFSKGTQVEVEEPTRVSKPELPDVPKTVFPPQQPFAEVPPQPQQTEATIQTTRMGEPPSRALKARAPPSKGPEMPSHDYEAPPMFGKEDHPLRGEQMGFTDTAIRHKFIRKVYCIVVAQLCLTFSIILPFAFFMNLRMLARRFFPLALVWCCLSLCLLTAIMCGPPALRKKFPLNLVVLFYFTLFFALFFAWSIGMAFEHYDKWTVVIGFGITIAIVVVFTCFAMQTRVDITAKRGLIALAVITLYFLIIAWAAVGAFVKMTESTYNIVELVVASICLLLFIFLLVHDTQLLLGGKHKYAISPEDYVQGALVIYLDIMYIFYFLIRIIAAAKKA